MTIVTLGRLPKISLAELEALYGAEAVRLISPQVAAVDTKTLEHPRLGGTVRTGQSWIQLGSKSTSAELVEALADFTRNHAAKDGKTVIGISQFDGRFPAPAKAVALELKKALRSRGLSVRVVLGKKAELNAAEVLYNKLTAAKNFEFGMTRDASGQLVLFRTASIQDVDAYAARDHGRPKRDARVGMLPPKLAQTMINLVNPRSGQTILDPFCGTGVVLQESLLMGFKAYGTDLEPRMIEYSQKNLEWLKQKQHQATDDWQLETADARTHTWQQPVGAVVCETYLGPPLNTAPSPDKLKTIVSEVDDLLRAVLANLHRQLSPATTLCWAVPAWITGGEIKHLPLLDSLEDLGYTRQVFKHAAHADLVYSRPDQVVARELLVLIRK